MIDSLRGTVWNWLPTFWAVAETGSIVAASRQLHVTPAAISRTVRLLETELGEPVFNRVGRALVLNSRGASLRDAMRAAVATVDRGLSMTLATPFAGPLRVSSLGVLTEHFVVPCLIDLKRDHDAMIPEHLNLRTAEATELLVRGEIDLAFYYEEQAVDGITVDHIGQTPVSVYCGRGHPLFDRPRVTQRQVLDHPFSVPQVGDSGRTMDGWPTDLSRRVGMRITLLRSNVEVCLSGALVAVLPDVTAHEHVRARRLRRLPARALPPIDVFAARPASSLERGAAAELIERVTARITEANRALRRRESRSRKP